MFQGPIQAADYAASEETPILRQLRWTDLVARIAATREVRGVAPTPSEEVQASFAAFHHEPLSEGQQAVNRDALTHGKFARLSGPGAANNADRGDRETT